MEKEENVCVKTEGTEEKMVMENGANGCCENASAVPSKFKDVDALVRAYSALQSEFTRRSQRLKELERKVENLEGEGMAVHSGAEKLRKNAQVRRLDAARFNSFVAETEQSKAQGVEIAERMKTVGEADAAKAVEVLGAVKNAPDATVCAVDTATAVAAATSNEEPTKEQPLEQERLENGNETAEKDPEVDRESSSTDAPAHSEEGAEKQEQAEVGAKAFYLKKQAQGGEGQASVAGNEASFNPSDALYAQVCRDEGVRLRIIGEYLSSLGKSGAPLMTGGVGTFTTPPKRRQILRKQEIWHCYIQPTQKAEDYPQDE